jgi:hypothetical protein
MLNSQSAPCRAVIPIVMASIIAQRGAPMTLAFSSLPLTALAMAGMEPPDEEALLGDVLDRDKTLVFSRASLTRASLLHLVETLFCCCGACRLSAFIIVLELVFDTAHISISRSRHSSQYICLRLKHPFGKGYSVSAV